MNDGIPEDVTSDILSRLPVGASIARFCCVCKSWCHLLSDPSFIARKLSSSYGRDQIMIIKRFTEDQQSPVYTLHSADTLDPLSPSPVQVPFDPEKFSDIYDGRRFLKVAGYCDGLFCIFDLMVNDHLILWNPATSETKLLPPSPFYPHPRYLCYSAGLGFDSQNNDYKVVKLLVHYDDESLGRFYFWEVYSLRNDSWEKFDGDFPTAIRFEFLQIPQFHKGKLYWWSSSHAKGLRFDSFDVTSEVFQHVRVPCPSGKNLDNVLKCSLNVESMSALFPVFDDTLRKPFWEIWVLLKYWAPESWTKLLVVTPLPGMKTISCCHHFSRNLRCFFLNEANDYGDKCLFVYHPETGRFCELEDPGKKTWGQIITYVPSQISLRDYCMIE